MSPARMSQSHGLTLIELLAALVILSMLTGVVASWTSGHTRFESEARALLDDSALQQRVIELIRADLDCQATPRTDQSWNTEVQFEADGFSVVTSHLLHSDAPGWHRVRWFTDSQSHLIREATNVRSGTVSMRTVMIGVESIRVDQQEQLPIDSAEPIIAQPKTIIITFSDGSATTIALGGAL